MLKFIKNLFKHKHYYQTYNPEMCKYATCHCGCGISLEEAALNNIPVYWRESGELTAWNPEWILKLKEDNLRREKRLEA